MTDVYLVSDNIISPLGQTTAENWAQLERGHSGIRLHTDPARSSDPFHASLFEKDEILKPDGLTRFESLLVASIREALSHTEISLTDPRTILILSSTKGNIGLLETQPRSPALTDRLSLATSAKLIARQFGAANPPLLVSNACISGVLALLSAQRMLASGQYAHAVVAGADLITRFILSGFQALQAISPDPCRPFDATRRGITLGEAAGTAVLSTDKKFTSPIRIAGGATSNDANHISGPSRTGDGLATAIGSALRAARLPAEVIDFVSAHGTATLHNDEMEAAALTRAGVQAAPVNSLKGYFGHTLGAAGLIETLVSAQSLHENSLLPTAGFSELGVSNPLNVTSMLHLAPLRHCLKTASGFGGCNAALVLSKEE
ncbi:MAG: beta-ketoacyl synthase [Sphingobacteriaceae bacterium]|nr:beta-ketoacyl synthase [Cytophagaceae bacterium]